MLALAVLAIAGLVLLTQLVDPNRFRGDIEQAVRNATGRELRLRGDLTLTWFPWLAVTTRDAEISGSDGLEPLARWREARIGVRLLPMLQGRLDVDRVSASGLQLVFLRTADGRVNWRAPTAPAAQSGTDRPFVIAGLDLREAVVEFRDAQSGRYWRGCDLDLSTSALAPTTPVRATLSVRLLTGADRNCAEGWPLTIEGQYRPESQGFSVLGLKVAIGADDTAIAIPQLKVDVALQSLQLPAWSLQAGEGRMQGGALQLRWAPEVSFAGDVRMDALSPRRLASDLGWTLPATQDPEALGRLAGTLEFRSQDGRLELRGEALQLDDSRLSAELRRAAGAAAPFEFNARIDALTLDRYLPLRDPEAPPFRFPGKALRELQARGRIEVATLRWLDVVARDAALQLELRDGELRTVPAAP
jgi:AsmA protein